MKKLIVLIFCLIISSLFAFPPPENIAVDPYNGIVTWDPPLGMIYSDDFESYNVGEYLAVQSDYWTTWSNNPGSAEDAFISDDYALSETNSVKVDGSSDIVLIMDNYTSGCYSMELNMYIVSGNTAHFNLQKTNTQGEQWAMEINFYVNGEAEIFAGASAACVFLFDFDTWMNFEIIADLDNDLGELWFNGTQLHTWQWSLTTWGVPGLLSLGGLNLWAREYGGNPALAYYDDISITSISGIEDDLTGFNVYLDGLLQGYTTDLEYQLINLIAGNTYSAGVSAVYDDPGESEIVEVDFTYIGTSAGNIVATVTKLNNNYPNPFNPTTTISFSIPEESKVDLSIYNIKGQKVRQLVSDQLLTGQHSVVWDGKDSHDKQVSSGIYLYNLNIDDKTEATKKCLLLK